MKNYMMINDKKIEISQETANNIEKELGEKVTYSIGDRFIVDNIKNILASVESGTVHMVTLDRGFRHNAPVKVKDIYEITKPELKTICNDLAVRYWNSQKQVKCDT